LDDLKFASIWLKSYREEIVKMKLDVAPERSYRLLYPRQIVLVGCCSPDGKPNALTIAWFMPLSMSPPLVGISVSPKRYSHSLIEQTGDFTVNIPTMDILEKVHLFGSVSGKNVEKFASLGLTAEKARLVKSPIVKECVAHLECRLTESLRTGDHTLFIGEVLAAYADERFFRNGKFDLKIFRGIYQVGGSEYATISEITKEVGKY